MNIALSNGVMTIKGPVLLLFFFFSSLRIFFGDLFREHVDSHMILTALCHNLLDQFFFSCKLCSLIALTLLLSPVGYRWNHSSLFTAAVVSAPFW